jgi:C4-dicarboxylate-specific signal transduction histidine kinase
LTKASIESFLFEKSSDVKLVSLQRFITEPSSLDHILSKLIQIRNTYKNYEAFEVVDTNKKTIVHTSNLNINELTDSSALIDKTALTKSMQFALSIDKKFNKGKIKICTPVFRKNNKIVYYLIAHIPLDKAYQNINGFDRNIFDNLKIKTEIRTKDNQIIFRNHYDKNAFNFSSIQTLEENKEKSFYKNNNDIYFFTNFNLFQQNDNFDWYLISKININEINAPVDKLITKLILGAILFLALLLIVSHFLILRFLNPLDQLANSMNQLADGKFEKINTDTLHSSEIQRLIDGYNLMIDNLKNSIAEASKNSKFAALGQMSSGIAHEINNPLTIIKGLTFMITKLADTDQKQKIKEHSQRIEDTVDRISKIIKSLRAYARDEAQDPLKKESVNSIINSTLDLCSEKFKNYGITLDVFLPQNDIFINARSFQISQIIINLLNNASDEIINLDTKWIQIQAKTTGQGSIEISVENSGPKIPKEIADKLFVPFFTTKEVGKGTGLGLIISQSLAKSHNGDLKLDLSGSYTKFILVLPEHKDSSLQAISSC